MRLRDLSQEAIELGPRGTLFRASWEVRERLREVAGARTVPQDVSTADTDGDFFDSPWTTILPLADPVSVVEAMRGAVQPEAIASLRKAADEALAGRILCFGRWFGDFGNPIDWMLNPLTRNRFRNDGVPSRALRDQAAVGDVKLTWEAARFPHAYYLARAAAFTPDRAAEYATGLTAQIRDFVDRNPEGEGVHWASGQEIALRLIAWLFALDALLARGASRQEASRLVRLSLAAGARQIESRIDYARIAVRNNHLLSEALGLFVAGIFLAGPRAIGWRNRGLSILAEEAERQFYVDGASLNQSHNYQRSALMTLLWAAVFARAAGLKLPAACASAMDRSLTFLLAHQNPVDGALPNYGANDGSMPGILSTCAFSDFRPLLQTLSVAVRGERLYDAGPWDEMALWMFGPPVMEFPVRPPSRTSVSFSPTGYHVLRGRNESSFSAFRCGPLRDRFSQIDMLHLDVWWRGQNVLVDAGTYSYGDREWHEHFMRTGCHNTLTIDGHDQMLHLRQFKVIYWTDARMKSFSDDDKWALCAGEHYGYTRHPGRCVHARTVLYLKDDVWVVVDCLNGEGIHDSRLHWLCGDFASRYQSETGRLVLDTPEGPFSVTVLDQSGKASKGDVAEGQTAPPRGWMSRYYGDKIPVPSLAVSTRRECPITFISILSGVPYSLNVHEGTWTIEAPSLTAAFELSEGRVGSVRVRR